jgi:hypothetical protein
MNCEYQSLPSVKRGDTFILTGVYKVDGDPTSLTTYTVTSQVRDAKLTLIQQLTVTKGNQTTDPGSFTLSAGVITWRPGTYLCDVQFIEASGFVRSTETFYVPIEQDITYV